MAFILGLDAATYRFESGAAAVPGESPANYILMDNIKDETVNRSASTSDVSTRGTGGWRALVATLKEAGAQFQMVQDASDPDYVAFADLFNTNGTVVMRFFDGIAEATDTPIGIEGTFMITNFSENRSLEEAIMIDVEMVLSRGTTPTIYDGTVAVP